MWVVSIDGTPASAAQLCVTAFWGGNLRLDVHSGKRTRWCTEAQESGPAAGAGCLMCPLRGRWAPSCSAPWESSARQPLRRFCGGLRRPGVWPHLWTAWLLVSFLGSRPAAFSWVMSIRCHVGHRLSWVMLRHRCQLL